MRFPDAASSSRGKIVLAQSHAALGDWDSVKVAAAREISQKSIGLMMRVRPCWIISVMLVPNVFCYQVSSTHRLPSSSKAHSISAFADDIPLDRPPSADVALSFTLLAQAVWSLFPFDCQHGHLMHCDPGHQPRGPKWCRAALAPSSSSRSLLRGGFSPDEARGIG